MKIRDAEYRELFARMHPSFFAQASIRNIPEGESYCEMLLPLRDFDPDMYAWALPEDTAFGVYSGDPERLRRAVTAVQPGWAPYFAAPPRVYCGTVGGELASFCLIEDMGEHVLGGRRVRIGGPGCVGTLPAFRRRGVGLAMVCRVTQILKDEGYDYSYIHYTHLPDWYGKLGYETILRWDRNGLL